MSIKKKRLLVWFLSFQTKAYREYVVEKKNPDLLTEEDKYLLQLGRVERLSAKLSIMGYIGNFFDNVHLITPVRLINNLHYPSYIFKFSNMHS